MDGLNACVKNELAPGFVQKQYLYNRSLRTLRREGKQPGRVLVGAGLTVVRAPFAAAPYHSR